MSGFKLHPDAYTDLDQLLEYIARDSLDAADRVIQQIYEAIESAAAFPHQGHLRPDLTSKPLRWMACYEYLIAYAADEDPIWVLAVIHGRRSPRVLTALLRERRA